MKTTTNITAETRRLAAISRMTPRGERDSRGKLLPLRYRIAEELVAAADRDAQVNA